ncbi:hypothetical protein ND486_06465 [Pseudonocardia sp. DR1-2]|uniref:DUF6541 family protein n=1 Tax=Pseudonocardia sp. DR1-2 TaxID=2951168 RepID=UPI0020435A50|nr:DUF6541 family protein [Pseudonocardia sp. DR1-2]MCM3845837.1 hypothetical protein [Pseudonocardia sp. DR1-2]
MTWAQAVPVALVTAAWCVLPGALVARAAGLRGAVCWGAGPLVSVALIATTAVLAGRAGVPWGPGPVLGVTAVLALLCAAVSAAVRRVRRDRAEPGADPGDRPPFLLRAGPDGPLGGIALAIGTAVTVAIGWLTVMLAFGPVDAISPTYDAIYHYSAVARIVQTGDASSLTLGELNSPGRPSAYPAAWHDVVSLVVASTGASIPAASNLAAFAAAAVVWPLSCTLLVRQVVGRRAGALLVTPVLATAFTAMPWLLLNWGVLWPNLLGLALVPAGLAAVVTVLGLTRDSAVGRFRALLLGAAAVPALALAHPNAAVSLLVLALSPVVVAAAITTVRQVRRRRFATAALAPAGALAAVATVVWLLAWSPYLDGVRAFDWQASMGAREALTGVLWNGTNKRPELVVVSVLVVVGAVLALRHARTAWLVPAHLTSALLYTLAVAREGDLVTALTGAWYNDSHRLAAMVPITGVPLATLGVLGAAGLAVRAVTALRRAETTAERRRLLALPAVAVLAAALVLLTDGFRIGVHAAVIADAYRYETGRVLQPGQREFLEAAGRATAPGAVVAANPWTGNGLLYPLTGRQVLFPHLSGTWTPDQELVRMRLHDVARDPVVCPALRATGVGYVIDGPVTWWPWDPRADTYPGLSEIDRAPGFEPVLSGGGSTLYRITACGAGPARSTG